MTQQSSRWLATAGVTVAAAVTTLGLVAGSAGADPIASARAQATALSRQVNQLSDQAEAASQTYDQIEARLGAAVTSSLSADQQQEAARAATVTAQQQIDERVQALYAEGGSGGLLTAMLSGATAASAIERQALSATVLDNSTVAVSRDQMIAARASVVAHSEHLTAAEVTKLQVKASIVADRVNALLGQQRQALAHADSTVRHLMAQQAAAEAATESASFSQAVSAAGGSIHDASGATNPIAAAAIGFARTRLGVPYVWGATGPDSFDCSGLTQWSYAHAGIALPRTAAEQWYSGPHPALNKLEPGDLLFWAFEPNDPASIHHVAIYIGGGMMIAAPHTGEDVQIQPVYLDGFFGATRPTAG